MPKHRDPLQPDRVARVASELGGDEALHARGDGGIDDLLLVEDRVSRDGGDDGVLALEHRDERLVAAVGLEQGHAGWGLVAGFLAGEHGNGVAVRGGGEGFEDGGSR